MMLLVSNFEKFRVMPVKAVCEKSEPKLGLLVAVRSSRELDCGRSQKKIVTKEAALAATIRSVSVVPASGIVEAGVEQKMPEVSDADTMRGIARRNLSSTAHRSEDMRKAADESVVKRLVTSCEETEACAGWSGHATSDQQKRGPRLMDTTLSFLRLELPKVKVGSAWVLIESMCPRALAVLKSKVAVEHVALLMPCSGTTQHCMAAADLRDM